MKQDPIRSAERYAQGLLLVLLAFMVFCVWTWLR